MLQDIDMREFVIRLSAIIICITIHEFAHAYSALRAGDETAKANNRVSFNPIDHFDPLGFICMFVSSLTGYGIGWGKPVPVNPYNLRHPRWDNLMVSLWGPLSNLLTALVVGTALRFVLPAYLQGRIAPTELAVNSISFLCALTLVSIGLALFNLIPIPPLDGSHILSALLPYEQARRFDKFAGQFGMILFLGLIMYGSSGHGMGLSAVLGPPRRLLWFLFTGQQY